MLGHEAEGKAGDGAGGVEGLAVEGERAGIGGAEAGDEGHGGGLASAVGSEEAKEFAARDVEGDAVEGGEGAVAFGDGGEGEHGRSTGERCKRVRRVRAYGEPGVAGKVTRGV